jgi:chemotaxis protein CheX
MWSGIVDPCRPRRDSASAENRCNGEYNVQQISHDDLVRITREATKDVFSTMLGLQIQDGEPFIDSSAPKPSDGIVALVGMAGSWVGTGSFACSAELARHLSSQFLMSDFPAVDDEVLDAVAEITNMILGNVKTVLEEKLGPMGLSIPTVVYGRNFTTRSIGQSDWTAVPFYVDGMHLEVRVCLVPNKDRMAASKRAPAASIHP